MVKIPLRKETHSGGCQCGAVRYTIEGALGKAGICHCRMCQKAFGNFGAALVSVPAGNLAWSRGVPSLFRSSAIVSRGFCAACGTPLFMREDGDVNYELAIGTLDDPDSIPPMTEQSGTESRLSWFHTMHDLPEQKTADYRSAEDMEKLKSLQHPDHDTEHWP
ncbi:GFA family protein [Aestuariivirga sp.]|uniref:GFA family protein n=1 Tax=Aestuariivirga sp. TaxID=2650926 RepID=UPI00359443A3